MMFYRPGCLLLLILSFAAPAARGQQPPPAQQSPQQAPQQAPQQPKKPATPFETVPVGPEEAPKPAAAPTPAVRQARAGQPPRDVIESIVIRGSRRVPQDTLKALMLAKVDDPYAEDTLHRDFIALWNTHRFDDLRLEREPGETGWIITYIVTERPVIRSIKYEGAKSITVSEILDRFKERKVGLSVESQYDPDKIQRAKNVLLEYESERGHPDAKIEAEIHRVPPSSLEIVFNVDEGPKVKVGKILVEGNHAISSKEVVGAMKNSKPYGIPYSIFFESLFPKTYDSTKLEEDKSRVVDFYQQRGYFVAKAVDAKVEIRQYTSTSFWHIPIFQHPKPHQNSRADITMVMEEGLKYKLANITFTGVKFFKTPEALMGPLFGMQTGDTFSTTKLRKGIENMRKLYGEFGYIDFVAEPGFEPDLKAGTLDMSLAVDEGKQFFVRRIDFAGNVNTRDKVIRREMLIDEGDIFNNRLWEVSLLRLNQLGFFEPLKPEEAADMKRDTKTNTVDITLKVRERGKNSIQLNGGVSGIAGSFVGLSYSTNNFLGLGETLSLSSQLGTRLKQVQFGYTEPYLFDKRIQTGFTVYLQRFNYNQAREASVLSGQNLIPLYNQLGTNNLLNYVSNGYGATVFAQYPLTRSFAKVGLTYGYDVQNITTLTDAANQYFTYLDFQGVSGPNALQGIRTSKLTPSYTYNTIDHPITPTHGREFFVSIATAGIGGNVNTIEPTMDAKYFRKGFKKGHVIGMHFLGRFITGYGGKVAPPFSRYFIGGENDIRGFDTWGISPIAYIPASASINVLNADGSQRVQPVISNGAIIFSPVTQSIPIYRIVTPGGDTSIVTNFEYRIPIFGPVTLALFTDAGVNRISLKNQLRLNSGFVDQLNQAYPSAGISNNVQIQSGSEKPRVSTGVELQVLMPVVNAPFRVYWAYNPSVYRGTLQTPFAVDRSIFPNEATYVNAITTVGAPIPFLERHSLFRFSIGRTF
jgi:outer membrane protein insertion porin family